MPARLIALSSLSQVSQNFLPPSNSDRTVPHLVLLWTKNLDLSLPERSSQSQLSLWNANLLVTPSTSICTTSKTFPSWTNQQKQAVWSPKTSSTKLLTTMSWLTMIWSTLQTDCSAERLRSQSNSLPVESIDLRSAISSSDKPPLRHLQ